MSIWVCVKIDVQLMIFLQWLVAAGASCDCMWLLVGVIGSVFKSVDLMVDRFLGASW